MKVTALDENGKPVDWWFIYKVPQLGPGAGTDAATGYEYVYYDATIDADPNPRNRNVAKSPYLLNSHQGALNLTLNSVFKNYKNPPKSTGWILYNDEMPAIVEFEVAALQLSRDIPGFRNRNVRIISRIEDRDPLLMRTDLFPLPRRAVIAARGFPAVAQIGMTDTNEDRAQQGMRFGIAQRGDRTGRMADKDRLIIGAQTFEKRQPETRAGLHIVGERPVDHRDAQGGERTFQPRQPDITGRAAAVAVKKNDLTRRTRERPRSCRLCVAVRA